MWAFGELIATLGFPCGHMCHGARRQSLFMSCDPKNHYKEKVRKKINNVKPIL